MRAPLPAAFLATPIAHRAYHDLARGRPENSRAAIRAAVAAGYGIEIDLQLSKDGVPMVFHDETLERLTPRQGWVCDLPANELASIPLTGGDEAIPTLTEVLDLIAGSVPLLIELKDQTLRMADTDARLETATAAALARCAQHPEWFEPSLVVVSDRTIAAQAAHADAVLAISAHTAASFVDWARRRGLQPPEPVVVDLGYGRLPVTTLELAARLRTLRGGRRTNRSSVLRDAVTLMDRAVTKREARHG